VNLREQGIGGGNFDDRCRWVVCAAIAMAMAGPKLILCSMQPPAAAIGGGGSSTRRVGQTSMRFLGTSLLRRRIPAASRRGEISSFLTRKVH
jgi:hypothetical protein